MTYIYEKKDISMRKSRIKFHEYCIFDNSAHTCTKRKEVITKNNFLRKGLLFLLLNYLLVQSVVQISLATAVFAAAAAAATTKDLYTTLSIPKTASQKEITKAYRKLALKYHPDKVSPEERDVAEQKFKEIGHAHDVLSDESKRKLYDVYGEQGLDPSFHPGAAAGAGAFGGMGVGVGGTSTEGFSFDGTNIHDFFQSQGSSHRRYAGRSMGGFSTGAGAGVDDRNIHSNGIHIDLSEILQNFMMDGMMGNDGGMRMNNNKGFGKTGSSMGMNMNGQRQQSRNNYYFDNNASKPRIQQFYCSLNELSNTNGCTKKLKVSIDGGHEKIYTINVQPGWKEGTKIKFKATKDGLFPPMTFILREKKHKYLVRDGDNLIFHCTVTGRQAKRGAKIKVPLPDGEMLEIETSPNEITKGYVKQIIGKGMPKRTGKVKNHSRGDLVVQFRIKEES